MILINKGESKKIYFTIDPTISPVYYLFEFVSNNTNNKTYMMADDISTNSSAYKAFLFQEGSTQSMSGGFILNPGTYDYNLYETGTQSLDPLLATSILEIGLMTLLGDDFCYSPDINEDYVYYDECSGPSIIGVTGPAGATGATGYNGTAGTSGTSGTSGLNGTSGVDGTSGVNGTSGTSGLDGTSGTSGVSGSNGTSGSSGTSGVDGANGISSGQIYYMNQSISAGINSFRQLSIEPTSFTPTTVTASTTGTTPVLVTSFITEPLGFTVIPGGVQRFNTHFLKDLLGSKIDIYLTIQLYSGIGTPIGPELSTNISAIGWIDNVTPVEVTVDLTLPTTMIDPSDRMAVRLYIKDQSAGSHQAIFYTEGTQYYSFISTSVGQVAGTSGTSGTSGVNGTSGTSPTGGGGAAGLIAGVGLNSIQSNPTLTPGATAIGSNSIAIGSTISAYFQSVTIGTNITDVATSSVYIGNNINQAFGVEPTSNTVAIGSNIMNRTSGPGTEYVGGSVLIGHGVKVDTFYFGHGNVSIGTDAQNTAFNSDSVSIGAYASVGRLWSVAIGRSANAAGAASLALGVNSSASTSNALAIMGNASGESSAAIGHGAASSGYESVALGRLASATHAGSVALGLNVASVVTNHTHINNLHIKSAPVYADNTAALAAGLVEGQIYRTSTGDLKIAFTA